MQKKEKLFTAGQFARLYHINKKTLLFYHQIGLFSPAVVGDNRYRYYSYRQCAQLETILLLRQLNFSLEEIRDFMQNPSPTALRGVYLQKIQQIDAQLIKLRQLKEALVWQSQEIDRLQDIDLGAIGVQYRPAQCMLVCPVMPHTTPEEETKMLLQGVGDLLSQNPYGTAYGTMVPTEKLYSHQSEEYSAVYMLLEPGSDLPGAVTRPNGLYLCGWCLGSWDNLPACYDRLLAYAADQGLTLGDYSYETSANEMFVQSEEEYITQIEIPIQ